MLLDGRAERLLVANVEGRRRHAAAIFADLGCGRVELLLLAPGDDHVGAGAGKLVRRSAPDAAVASADDDDAIAELIRGQNRAVTHMTLSLKSKRPGHRDRGVHADRLCGARPQSFSVNCGTTSNRSPTRP